MNDKNSENSSNGDSSKLLEQDEIPSNFKLFYRNTKAPERDKSSGVSSDEETTSSSLVPIPDTLKQLRNKSKWTPCDVEELSEEESARLGRNLGKNSENIMNSLEELRKKYILKNESSVAFKMNSANLMLDDILNSASVKKAPVDSPQSKFVRQEEYKQKSDFESDTTTTETSVTNMRPCPHVTDHCHPAIPLDFYSSLCSRHCSATQNFDSSKDPNILKRNSEGIQRKKTFVERIQGLQNMFKVQSVYKTFQKTKNPFTKTRKDIENKDDNHQGIPATGCQGDGNIYNQPFMCKCKLQNFPFHQFPQKMMLDLVENSEMSQSDIKSTGRDTHHCTCNYERRCSCPEILPQCFCVQHIQVSESIKKNSHSDNPNRNIGNNQDPLSVPIQNTIRSNSSEKETRDHERQKSNSVNKNFKGKWKHCSKEKNVIERTDIYYFDHGNSAYYQTTDNHPMRYTECLVERTDEYATKFWAEFFGSIEIGMAFIISFILQFYRFLFTSIIRSLTVGLLQIFSDYLFKPLLTIIFNGIIQPCLILVYNIATSVRDLCLPISEIFGFFAKEVAFIIRSCRLVDINHNRAPSCNCGNKV